MVPKYPRNAKDHETYTSGTRAICKDVFAHLKPSWRNGPTFYSPIAEKHPAIRPSSLAEVPGERKERRRACMIVRSLTSKLGKKSTKNTSATSEQSAHGHEEVKSESERDAIFQEYRSSAKLEMEDDSNEGSVSETHSLPDGFLFVNPNLAETVSEDSLRRARSPSRAPSVQNSPSKATSIAPSKLLPTLPSSQPPLHPRTTDEPTSLTLSLDQPSPQKETLTSLITSFTPTPIPPYTHLLATYKSSTNHRTTLCLNNIQATSTLITLQHLFTHANNLVRARVHLHTGMPPELSEPAARKLVACIREAARVARFWEEKVESVRQVGSVYLEFWREYEVEMRKVGWVEMEGLEGEMVRFLEGVDVLVKSGEVGKKVNAVPLPVEETSGERSERGTSPIEEPVPASPSVSEARPEGVDKGKSAVPEVPTPVIVKLPTPLAATEPSRPANPATTTRSQIPRMANNGSVPDRSLPMEKPKPAPKPNVFDRLYTPPKRSMLDSGRNSKPTTNGASSKLKTVVAGKTEKSVNCSTTSRQRPVATKERTTPTTEQRSTQTRASSSSDNSAASRESSVFQSEASRPQASDETPTPEEMASVDTHISQTTTQDSHLSPSTNSTTTSPTRKPIPTPLPSPPKTPILPPPQPSNPQKAPAHTLPRGLFAPPTAPAAMRAHNPRFPPNANVPTQPRSMYASASLPSRRSGGLAGILAQYERANGGMNAGTGTAVGGDVRGGVPVVASSSSAAPNAVGNGEAKLAGFSSSGPPLHRSTSFHSQHQSGTPSTISDPQPPHPHPYPHLHHNHHHHHALNRSTPGYTTRGRGNSSGSHVHAYPSPFPDFPDNGFQAGYTAGIFAAGYQAASLGRAGGYGWRGGYGSGRGRGRGGGGRGGGGAGRGGYGSLG